jgi:acyl carrier protein
MQKEVIELISKTLDINKKDININTNLVKDLNIESLDLVDLVVAFEKKYNIEIKDNDIKNLQTVEDIVNYLEAHV